MRKQKHELTEGKEDGQPQWGRSARGGCVGKMGTCVWRCHGDASVCRSMPQGCQCVSIQHVNKDYSTMTSETQGTFRTGDFKFFLSMSNIIAFFCM